MLSKKRKRFKHNYAKDACTHTHTHTHFNFAEFHARYLLWQERIQGRLATWCFMPRQPVQLYQGQRIWGLLEDLVKRSKFVLSVTVLEKLWVLTALVWCLLHTAWFPGLLILRRLWGLCAVSDSSIAFVVHGHGWYDESEGQTEKTCRVNDAWWTLLNSRHYTIWFTHLSI